MTGGLNDTLRERARLEKAEKLIQGQIWRKERKKGNYIKAFKG